MKSRDSRAAVTCTLIHLAHWFTAWFEVSCYGETASFKQLFSGAHNYNYWPDDCVGMFLKISVCLPVRACHSSGQTPVASSPSVILWYFTCRRLLISVKLLAVTCCHFFLHWQSLNSFAFQISTFCLSYLLVTCRVCVMFCYRWRLARLAVEKASWILCFRVSKS